MARIQAPEGVPILETSVPPMEGVLGRGGTGANSLRVTPTDGSNPGPRKGGDILNWSSSEAGPRENPTSELVTTDTHLWLESRPPKRRAIFSTSVPPLEGVLGGGGAGPRENPTSGFVEKDTHLQLESRPPRACRCSQLQLLRGRVCWVEEGKVRARTRRANSLRKTPTYSSNPGPRGRADAHSFSQLLRGRVSWVEEGKVRARTRRANFSRLTSIHGSTTSPRETGDIFKFSSS
jgi:hypothetical protein